MTASERLDDQAFKAPAERATAYYFYLACVLTALTAAAVLIANDAQAQAQTQLQAQASANAEPVVVSSTPATAPRYSAKDIERAFGFIDSNKDGKISREEASGFRNVAKYFDAADMNKDGALSLEEFGNALNRP